MAISPSPLTGLPTYEESDDAAARVRGGGSLRPKPDPVQESLDYALGGQDVTRRIGKTLEAEQARKALGLTDSEKLGYDAVTTPNHYTRFKVEPITFIMENGLPFWAGSVIKYVLRYDAKNGLEDLKKARRYLDMQIAKMEGKPDWNK